MQDGDFGRQHELQSLLADERSRCNQYKQIYQALKEEFLKAQDELVVVRQELKNTLEQCNLEKASKESYIKKLETAIAEKQEEIAVLNQKVLSLNEDDIRKKVQSEERKRYEDILSKNDAEVDELRELYNSSHYDNTMLKSKLEFLEKEHERAIELIKVQHLAEISDLKAKNDALQSEAKQPVKNYLVEFRAAENTIMQLTSRLNVMRSECDELRAKNGELMSQLEQHAQTHAKQLGDQMANIKSYESTKEILTMQKELLQNEVSKLEQEKSSLRNEIQNQKHEILNLKCQVEESEHKYNVETTNLNVALRECNAECESTKEQMKDQVDRVNAELSRLNQLLLAERQAFSEKEENLKTRLSFFQQQMYQKCSDKDQMLEKMEYRLKELEVAKNEELDQLKQQLKNSNNQLLTLVQEKSQAEKELISLRAQVEAEVQKNGNKILEDLLKTNTELNTQIQSLKENVRQLLRDTESQKHTTEQPKAIEQSESELAKLQLTLEQQKYQYQQRIDGLESQINEQQNAYFNEKKEMQTKLKQYAQLITKLRDKIDTQKAQMDELEVRNEILKLGASTDDHMKMKQTLADLTQKQRKFHEVIASLPRLPGISSLMEGDNDAQPEEFSRSLQIQLQENKEDEERTVPKRKLYRKRREASIKMADFSSSSDAETL